MFQRPWDSILIASISLAMLLSPTVSLAECRSGSSVAFPADQSPRLGLLGNMVAQVIFEPPPIPPAEASPPTPRPDIPPPAPLIR
jgi:hypothetical protein